MQSPIGFLAILNGAVSQGNRERVTREKDILRRPSIVCLYPNDRVPIRKRSGAYTQIETHYFCMGHFIGKISLIRPQKSACLLNPRFIIHSISPGNSFSHHSIYNMGTYLFEQGCEPLSRNATPSRGYHWDSCHCGRTPIAH